MQKEPITKVGVLSLERKIRILKKLKPQVINAIKKARAFGDLKENAEYHASKEELLIIEKKIRELERYLLMSVVVNTKDITDLSTVRFGALIKFKDLETCDLLSYHIVGEYEANVHLNKVSIKSSLAKKTILKRRSDIIIEKMATRCVKYEILDIIYI